MRSFGSSISKKISRCHVPNAGSPAATGIACDVADSSIAFTCACPFLRSSSCMFWVRMSKSSCW